MSEHIRDGLLEALNVSLTAIGQALETDDLKWDGDVQQAVDYSLKWYRQVAGREHEYAHVIRGDFKTGERV